MFSYLLILPCLLIIFQPLNARVEAPNYHFNMDTLNDFYPKKDQSELEKKYGKAEFLSKENGVQTLKFKVVHARYQFPVIVQTKEGKVLDFFARLPSYFLHDVFFQSLVNRIGKQNEYKRVGEEAVYVWSKDSLKHVYSAACTITCFPIFYTVSPTEKMGGFKPLIEKMKGSVPKF